MSSPTFKDKLWPALQSLSRVTLPRAQWIDVRDNQAALQFLRYTLRSDSNCVDVGCNEGTMLEPMVRLAPMGEHHAFEPNPFSAERLKKRYPRVNVHAAAVSNATGETEFHLVESNPGYSGLLRRQFDRAHEIVRNVRVPMVKLDDVLPTSLHVALIKIDVEGAEYQVLQGAINTIQRCRPALLIEHGKGASDVYGTTPAMLYDLVVRACGLALFAMDGTGPLSLADLEAVYEANSAWNFIARVW